MYYIIIFIIFDLYLEFQNIVLNSLITVLMYLKTTF